MIPEHVYEKLKNQHILITGACGLIGTHFVKYISDLNVKRQLNIRLTLLVRSEEKARVRFGVQLESDMIRLLIGDVCDEKLFLNQDYEWDYIVHAAGPADPRSFSLYPVETMKANILGTMNLLEYMNHHKQLHPVKKLVYCSSGEVYGDAPMPDERGFTEDCPGVVQSMNPRACYPEGKRAGETLCLSYYQEYRIPSVVARLGYIYGEEITEECSRADAQFLRNARSGEDIVMKSEGLQLRSYCYAEDAIEALLLLLTDGVSGEAYNVANPDEVMTIREFAERLAAKYGVGIRFEIPEDIEKRGYSQMKREVLNAHRLNQLGWKISHFD